MALNLFIHPSICHLNSPCSSTPWTPSPTYPVPCPMPQPLQLAPQVDEDDPPRAHGQGPEAALYPQGRPRDRPQELLPLHAQGYAGPCPKEHTVLFTTTQLLYLRDTSSSTPAYMLRLPSPLPLSPAFPLPPLQARSCRSATSSAPSSRRCTRRSPARASVCWASHASTSPSTSKSHIPIKDEISKPTLNVSARPYVS